jgi:hypothetical protein
MRVDNRLSYKKVFSALGETLQQAAAEHHHLSIVHSLVQAHEQVRRGWGAGGAAEPQ